MRAKFVNETINFERRKDSLSSLSVGQKQLIRSWLDEMGVKNYTINDDLTINVKSDVYLNNRGLVKFPNYIRFRTVRDWFGCMNNQLISLEGCPNLVGRDFYCSNNRLMNLKGCPSQIGGDFYCDNNKIKFTEEYVRSMSKIKGDVYI